MVFLGRGPQLREQVCQSTLAGGAAGLGGRMELQPPPEPGRGQSEERGLICRVVGVSRLWSFWLAGMF